MKQGVLGTLDAFHAGMTAPAMSQEQQEAARTVAFNTAGLGMALSDAPVGSLGTFAGPRAQGANLNARAMAQYLENMGKDKDVIWHQTGWFRGVDGNWKWEVPNDQGQWLNDPKNRGPILGSATSKLCGYLPRPETICRISLVEGCRC